MHKYEPAWWDLMELICRTEPVNVALKLEFIQLDCKVFWKLKTYNLDSRCSKVSMLFPVSRKSSVLEWLRWNLRNNSSMSFYLLPGEPVALQLIVTFSNSATVMSPLLVGSSKMSGETLWKEKFLFETITKISQIVPTNNI